MRRKNFRFEIMLTLRNTQERVYPARAGRNELSAALRASATLKLAAWQIAFCRKALRGSRLRLPCGFEFLTSFRIGQEVEEDDCRRNFSPSVIYLCQPSSILSVTVGVVTPLDIVSHQIITGRLHSNPNPSLHKMGESLLCVSNNVAFMSLSQTHLLNHHGGLRICG